MPKAAKVPKVRFNLKNYEDRDGEKQIIAVFRYPESQMRLAYYTGHKLKERWWNTKERRAKESVNFTDGVDINEELAKIEILIKDIYKNNSSISVDIFRDEIDIRLGRKIRPKSENQMGFFQSIDKIVDERRRQVNGSYGQTWQKFKTSKAHLSAFAKYWKGKEELDYDEIDEEFKEVYMEWLYRVKDMSQNTVNKEIANVKQFLKLSKRHHSNNYYNDDGFKESRKYVPKYFPTIDELKILLAHQFKSQRLQNAVDLFLVSAFGGGLRWSDVIRLTKENEIEESGTLQVFTHKGRNTKSDNEVGIPITPQLRMLIGKYNWKFPKMSEQEVNRSLKIAFEKAGIHRKVNVKSAKKNGIVESKHLYEVISFHKARYAYINFMMNELGVRAEKLQKITGQSLKVLLDYEQGNKQRNASEVGANINPRLLGLHVLKNKAI